MPSTVLDGTEFGLASTEPLTMETWDVLYGEVKQNAESRGPGIWTQPLGLVWGPLIDGERPWGVYGVYKFEE